MIAHPWRILLKLLAGFALVIGFATASPNLPALGDEKRNSVL
jgi:hypothetical protein